MKRNGKQKQQRGNQNGLYELPELSERYGAFVTVQGFEQARIAAQKAGASVIWEVERVMGIIPVATGNIWALIDDAWVKVPDDYRCCNCAECAAATKH